MENADIRALVDIENRFKYKDRDLMFHIDWIGADGRSFYTKQIILAPTDSSTVLQSSISISPGDREPGEYNFKIYFFRELIAEKKFEILPKFELLSSTGEKISSDIRLYRYKSKKSGKLIGEGTTFTIKEKAKVRALIELENRFVYGRQELRFQLEWIGPDSKSFYEKDIILEPQDSTFIINSYISIPPEKREPGEYALRVSLFDILLQEKKFLLVL